MDLAVTNTRKNRIHPQMFALWLAFASIFMMFAALTSAYIVRQAAGMWLEFPLPDIFKLSTLTILLSSVVLHIGYKSFSTGHELRYKLLISLGLLLGLTFVVLQYYGWLALYDMGVPLDINPSASFVYVISGFHVLHVLGGITALMVAVLFAFSLPFKPTAERKRKLSMTLHYWHFVDILWLYLFLFITFYN